MNTLNHQIRDIYKNIFEIVSLNKNIFCVKIYERVIENHQPNIVDYNFDIDTIEEIEIPGIPVSLCLRFSFLINFEALTKEYTRIYNANNRDLEDLIMTKESTQFCQFLQNDWFNVIQHLKAFNHEEDNYIEIAILLFNRIR